MYMTRHHLRVHWVSLTVYRPPLTISILSRLQLTSVGAGLLYTLQLKMTLSPMGTVCGCNSNLNTGTPAGSHQHKHNLFMVHVKVYFWSIILLLNIYLDRPQATF